MIVVPPTGIGSTLTLIKPFGGSIALRVGDLVKAQVLDIRTDGTISLRIEGRAGGGVVVAARTEVPLDKGDAVMLRVLRGDGEVRLRFAGAAGDIRSLEKMEEPDGPEGTIEDKGGLFRSGKGNRGTRVEPGGEEEPFAESAVRTGAAGPSQRAPGAEDASFIRMPYPGETPRDAGSFPPEKERAKKGWCSCAVDLDLESLGHVGVSVTRDEGGFFVSLFPGDPETVAFIASESGELERRFQGAGLPLKGFRVGRGGPGASGSAGRHGVDLKA